MLIYTHLNNNTHTTTMQNTTTATNTVVNALFNNVVTTQHNTAATTAYYCVMQAQAQNKANANLYSAKQKAFAYSIYNMCTQAFIRSTCYVNLRNTFISVKVANVTKQCYLSAQVNALLAQIATNSNIKVKQTKNALIFNIYF